MNTDLNQRERQRFATQLRQLADAATKCAAALEAENDTEATVQYVWFSLLGPEIGKELGQVILAAAEVESAKRRLPDSPEIV